MDEITARCVLSIEGRPMPRIHGALPRWTTLVFFVLVSILAACGDAGTGLRDDSLDDVAAFLLQSVTVGIRHTCGLTAEGKAHCWGSNEYGQLGDGTTTNRSTPAAVAGELTFRSLEAGGVHNCGITTEGATWCWGGNFRGQLGDGTTADRPVPGRVAGATGLVSLSLGGGYSCGLTAAGVAYCWGGNGLGNFGNGKEVWDVTNPEPAALGLTLRTLEPGAWHACGLAIEEKVYCWGSNANGQVGDGTATERWLTPVPVASDGRYSDLAGGSTYACALQVEGGADCWGYLPHTYMNDKTPAPGEVVFPPTTPRQVAPGLKFRSVSVGAEVACGLTDDGAAHCWGDHLHGALGDGTMRDPNNPNDRPRMTPALVHGGREFQIIEAGNRTACGLTVQGVAWCWGRNDYGQLGDGTTQDRAEPVIVRAPR